MEINISPLVDDPHMIPISGGNSMAKNTDLNGGRNSTQKVYNIEDGKIGQLHDYN